MNQKGPILFIALAVVLAATAAWAANKWMQTEADRRASKRVVTVPVVVMKTDVEAGQKLEAKHLTVQPWPRNALPAGRIAKISDAVGRVALGPLVKGEAVVKAKLAKRGPQAGLSAMVPPGFRAMTVRVDEVIGVGGFVQPGDRVDVLVTVSTAGFRDDPVTRTVLTDVPVLTVGERVEKNSDSKRARARKVRVVTLKVDPRQGERLALAATVGEILLSLRNRGEGRGEGTGSSLVKTAAKTPGVNLTALVGPPVTAKKPAPKPVPVKKRVAAAPKVSGPSVEIIKGVERSVQTL